MVIEETLQPIQIQIQVQIQIYHPRDRQSQRTMNLRRVDPAPIENSLGRKTLANSIGQPSPLSALSFWRKKYLGKSLDDNGGELRGRRSQGWSKTAAYPST